jgi:hypothetical protein
MPNRPTYGVLAFGSSGIPPYSTYRIAPANNMLQKNMYGEGYSKFMDYGAIDAFPNPGYGAAIGMPGDQDARASLYTSFPRMVPQGGFATQGETSGRFHKVLWAR